MVSFGVAQNAVVFISTKGALTRPLTYDDYPVQSNPARQKDRKTEIQKDRNTERQKDRRTERQKDRKTAKCNKVGGVGSQGTFRHFSSLVPPGTV